MEEMAFIRLDKIHNDRFERKLKKLTMNKNVTVEDLVQAIFDWGILDKYVPENIEELRIRQEERRSRNRPIFSRDGSLFFWRLLYSLVETKRAFLKNETLFAGYCISPIYWALNIPEIQKHFSKRTKLYNVIFDRLIELTKEKIRKFDQEPHIIPFKATGKINGIDVTVYDRYAPDGLVFVLPVNPNDSLKTRGNFWREGFPPETLNPHDFS